MKLIQWAIHADEQFRSDPLHHNPVDFDLPGARIFYIDKNQHIASHSIHDDVYDGLHLVMRHPIPDCQILGIETCGWAAPLGPDGLPDETPSQHPARRRVRMLTVADQRLNTASLIIFEDDPENPVTDEDGEGSGTLADALRRTMIAIGIRTALRGIVRED